jgi:hypothetical protein
MPAFWQKGCDYKSNKYIDYILHLLYIPNHSCSSRALLETILEAEREVAFCGCGS